MNVNKLNYDKKHALAYSFGDDWLFDVVQDGNGHVKVDAAPSAVGRPLATFTRTQLIELRREIGAALRNYPKPTPAMVERARNALAKRGLL